MYDLGASACIDILIYIYMCVCVIRSLVSENQIVSIQHSEKSKKRGDFRAKRPYFGAKTSNFSKFGANFFLFIYNIVSDAIARGETFHSLQSN